MIRDWPPLSLFRYAIAISGMEKKRHAIALIKDPLLAIIILLRSLCFCLLYLLPTSYCTCCPPLSGPHFVNLVNFRVIRKILRLSIYCKAPFSPNAHWLTAKRGRGGLTASRCAGVMPTGTEILHWLYLVIFPLSFTYFLYLFWLLSAKIVQMPNPFADDVI